MFFWGRLVRAGFVRLNRGFLRFLGAASRSEVKAGLGLIVAGLLLLGQLLRFFLSRLFKGHLLGVAALFADYYEKNNQHDDDDRNADP